MMGKKRKFPKGHVPSGFLSGYRHEAETIGESEGHGSSGRADMEVTVSKDFGAHKRRCISLNAGCNDTFSVRMQVLRLSNLTRPEIRDMEQRLRTELDQVQALRGRVESADLNGVTLSPLSEIHGAGSVKRRPPFGKKRGPARGIGSHTRHDGIRHHEVPMEGQPLCNYDTMLRKKCEALLTRLMTHPKEWFNAPVDTVGLKIPDYFTIIKNPMDLGTVKKKLTSGRYFDLRDFAADVRLTFSNAMTYNPPGNNVHALAARLSKLFESRWKPIEKKLPALLESAVLSSSVVDMETDASIPQTKMPKITSVDLKEKPVPVKRVMTDEEKRTLGTELEALLGELPENIIDFLKEHSSSNAEITEDEIEIDIDALGDDTLFELQKLLKDHLLEKQQKMEKIESSDIELPNESGLSNSSMQPCKANELVDEDIDIGGSDPPTLAYPPVVIEKDTSLRNCKYSSSSSSSSESGSSSSDSDSDSSSGSELGIAQTSAPHASKEAGSGASLNEGKNALIGLGQVVQASADLMEDQLDGESAPSERQVSPEKLYRAALLKNRFADTILKAREKTLEKAETVDPEKLRLEKEELERRQREEKAQLLAEAKAAEEAQRKAAAQAAAEARRRRELEREAARMALQQMEKTVDINENSKFLEDLEMLQGAADDERLAFMEEMAPDCVLNALGGYKFEGAGNPLEQLGLYRKDEEEDEEEDGEPHRVRKLMSGAAEEDEARKSLESAGESKGISERAEGDPEPVGELVATE